VDEKSHLQGIVQIDNRQLNRGRLDWQIERTYLSYQVRMTRFFEQWGRRETGTGLTWKQM